MTDPNENRPGYRKTKVGWLPRDWCLALASTFNPFVTSGSRGWAEFYSDHGALFMRITNLRRETPRPDLADARYVCLPADSAEGRRTLLHKGDILISITADLGIIGHVSADLPSPAYISQHIAILRFPETVPHDREYLAYSLAGERMAYHFYKVTDQGAKAGLNLNTVRKLPLIFPPLPEQQKIAAILSTWDDAIDKTRDLIAAKNQQKKALMQQLLTGKRRLPGFKGEWVPKRLSSLVERIKETAEDPEKYPVLSITAKTGFVSQTDKFSRVIAGKHIENYVVLKRGEFSYNKGNSYRYPQGCAYQLHEYDEGLVPSVFYTFRVKPRRVFDGFIKHFFSAGLHNPQLYRWINTGVRNNGLLNLNASDFFNIQIPLPDLVEQRAIAEILTTADREIASIEAKLTAQKEQKKGLMQRLLSGQVRVKA